MEPELDLTLPPARATRGPNRKPTAKSSKSAAPSGQSTPSAGSLRFSPVAVRRDACRNRAKDQDAGGSAPRRIVLPKSSIPPEQQLPIYRLAVEFGTVGFHQIDGRTWVAQVCSFPDGLAYTAGVDGWVVIKCEVNVHEELSYDCIGCPDRGAEGSCVHVRLLGSEDPPTLRPISEQDSPRCVLFHHAGPESGNKLTIFYVNLSRKGQSLVSHFGRSTKGGRWACRKCANQQCEHVQAARKHAPFEILFEEYDEPSDEDEAADVGETELQRVEQLSSANEHDERSISRLPVGPPLWARLPTDTAPTYPPLRQNPGHLVLGNQPRCRCGNPPDVTKPVRTIACIVYGSYTAWKTTIEVQRCSSCRPESRQYAGPDLRDLGIFNYNNSKVFTHELLNGFTSAMTTSETPFNSYHTVIERNYEDEVSPASFIGNELMRVVWFAFSRVQDLGDSFLCDDCGPEPDVVLFDGITAGYGSKHITASLRPPTMTDTTSLIRTKVGAPASPLTFVPTERLRRRAQQAVRWRKALAADNASVLPAEGEDASSSSGADESDDATGIEIAPSARVPDEDTDYVAPGRRAAARRSKRDKADDRMRASITGLASDLAEYNEGLAVLFGVHVASGYDEDLEEATRLYLDLLEQVLAYESALQFAPEESWPHIMMLGQGDIASADVLLPLVPALRRVAKHELYVYENQYSDYFKQLATFVYERARDVGACYEDHDPDEALLPQPIHENWRETGVFYGGRPRIHSRPIYPHLKNDQKADRATVTDAGGTIGCSKYYQLYGRKGLTGGLMVAWCTHSCCIGFHVIPRGEGRNDVFSALFCYWRRPPRTVIYDFSCALAAYCLLREYRHFRLTQFLIDHFHSEGHTRCSKACFIRAYREYSARLRGTNSSASESGNAGLHKIRKTLSYLTQRHAVVFCYVFLAIWNRQKRRKLAEKAMVEA